MCLKWACGQWGTCLEHNFGRQKMVVINSQDPGGQSFNPTSRRNRCQLWPVVLSSSCVVDPKKDSLLTKSCIDFFKKYEQKTSKKF